MLSRAKNTIDAHSLIVCIELMVSPQNHMDPVPYADMFRVAYNHRP